MIETISASMSEEQIKRNVKKYISDNFLMGGDFDEVTEEDSLLENGIVDSTGILELVTFIEENYDIDIDDEEMIPENLDSLNNLTRFILKKASENPQ